MDYFNYSRRRGNSVNQDRLNAPLPPTAQTPGGEGLQQVPTQGQSRRPLPAGSYESLRAPSSIRIRRLPSGMGTPRPPSQGFEQAPPTAEQDFAQTGRRRSSSEPQRYGSTLAPPHVDLSRQRTQEQRPHEQRPQDMPTITEGVSTGQREPSESSQQFHDAGERPATPSTPSINISDSGSPADRVVTGASAMAEAGNAARANRGLSRYRTAASSAPRNEQLSTDEYGSDIVDLLDLVDPEVRTLGTLTNVQNSLFVPDLGRLLNRRPTYNLNTQRTTSYAPPPPSQGRSRAGTAASRPVSDLPTIPQDPQSDADATPGDIEMQTGLTRRMSISSALSDSRYAVLPHGISLEGWTEEDKADLDDHVRHLMHSRREGFRRSMRGFGQYVSKPLGLFVFVYATLVTVFGAGWVFFLIGWIYVGHKQQYIINIIDNLLVALFALMGDGLAPFRMVDTYHMIFIARYHHLTWSLREKKQLPDLVDHNDLPERRASVGDVEDAIDKEETAEFSVLKPIQQKRLQYHQAKFSKAHTFYRPHETSTHHAFPLRLLIAIVVLLDFHSIFQVALGTCTWSWDYHTRPEALTSAILACSLSCNITAGILISVGDHRTRKKDVLERIHRQELTQEALNRMADERQGEERIARKSVEVSRAAVAQERAREHELEQQQMPAVITTAPTQDGESKKFN